MPVRKLTSEQRLSRAIDIMEALYAAGENGMTRNEICSRFDITGRRSTRFSRSSRRSRTENRARASSANATASVWSSPVTPVVCYRCA